MKWSVHAGRIGGIEIRIHATFLLILGWAFWRGWSGGSWQDGAWTALMVACVFACVVLHELGHSLVARRLGIAVHGITLYPIGGVASLARIPERPRDEFLIAVAGPAVSVLLAAFFALVGGGWPDLERLDAIGTLPWLGGMLTVVNAGLAIFNLVPAFPTDGGRILRSFLAVWLPYPRATAIATGLGQVAAVGILGFGYQSDNPFLPVIAIFLFFAARRENALVRMRHALRAVPAERAMTADFPRLAPYDSIEQAVAVFRASGLGALPVFDGERLVGLLDLVTLRRRVKGSRGGECVGDWMQRHLVVLEPEADLERLLPQLLGGGQAAFPVVRDGVVIALVTRESVARLLRPESAAPAPGRWRMDLG